MKSDSLRDHYHQPDLTATILASLQAAGINPAVLTRDDLNSVDEFHLRGREATVELAELADLLPAHKVLDLGCGIGGAARFLAAEYQCQVMGLDLIQAYCETATELSRLVGLMDLVAFRSGDMTAMPFADASFDRVWSQHAMMNVADKAALTAEIRRVLRPGGRAVFYEICAGNGDPVHLPVPWASEPEHSHLLSAAGFREIMTTAGLKEELWEDVTAVTIEWLDSLDRGRLAKSPAGPGRPGLGLLMGPKAGLKSRNLARSLREHRIVVIRGIYSL